MTDIAIPRSILAKASSVILSVWLLKKKKVLQHFLWRMCVYRHPGAVWKQSGAGGGWRSAHRSAGNQKLSHSPSGEHSYSYRLQLLFCLSQCDACHSVTFYVMQWFHCFQNLVKVMTICSRHDLVSLHTSRSFSKQNVKLAGFSVCIYVGVIVMPYHFSPVL